MTTATLARPASSSWINACILIGSALFVGALAVSAYFEPEWRVLHVFQGLIYVAVVVLAWRQSAWGYGAGACIATFWNVLLLFRSPFGTAAIEAIGTLARTGAMQRPDVWVQLFAVFGHFLIIVACLVAFLRERPDGTQWRRFVGGGVLAIGFLLVMAFTVGPPAAAEHLKQAFGL